MHQRRRWHIQSQSEFIECLKAVHPLVYVVAILSFSAVIIVAMFLEQAAELISIITAAGGLLTGWMLRAALGKEKKK